VQQTRTRRSRRIRTLHRGLDDEWLYCHSIVLAVDNTYFADLLYAARHMLVGS
jgi:hypothetical protein